MNEEYKVGNIAFDSKEEKDAAVKELYYIHIIKSKFDCTNPSDAQEVISLLKKSGIIKTKVGHGFIYKLQQVVNNKESQTVKEQESQPKEEEKAKAEEQARIEEEKAKAEEQARIEEEQAKAEEQARIEEEKAEAEEIARIEEERAKAKAQKEAARIEAEKAEAEAAKELARIEVERKKEAEKEQAERLAAEQAEEEKEREIAEKKSQEVINESNNEEIEENEKEQDSLDESSNEEVEESDDQGESLEKEKVISHFFHRILNKFQRKQDELEQEESIYNKIFEEHIERTEDVNNETNNEALEDEQGVELEDVGEFLEETYEEEEIQKEVDEEKSIDIEEEDDSEEIMDEESLLRKFFVPGGGVFREARKKRFVNQPEENEVDAEVEAVEAEENQLEPENEENVEEISEEVKAQVEPENEENVEEVSEEVEAQVEPENEENVEEISEEVEAQVEPENNEYEEVQQEEKNPHNLYFIIMMCGIGIVIVLLCITLMGKMERTRLLFGMAGLLVLWQVLAVIKARKINSIEEAINAKYHKAEEDSDKEYEEGPKGLSLHDLYANTKNHDMVLNQMQEESDSIYDVYSCFEWMIENEKRELEDIKKESKFIFSDSGVFLAQTKELERQQIDINSKMEELQEKIKIKVSFRMMPNHEKYNKIGEALEFFGDRFDKYYQSEWMDFLCNSFFEESNIISRCESEKEFYKKNKRVLNPYTFWKPTVSAVLTKEYYSDCRMIKDKVDFVREHLGSNIKIICKTVAEKIYGKDFLKVDQLSKRLLGELLIKNKDYFHSLGEEEEGYIALYQEEKEKLVSHPYEFQMGSKKTMNIIALATFSGLGGKEKKGKKS